MSTLKPRPPYPRALMVQDGARLHYAVPLALQKAGVLERVFTEWFVQPGSIEAVAASTIGRVNPSFGDRMRSRRCDQLNGKVLTNPWLALRHRLGRSRFTTSVSYHAWRAREVASWIARQGFGSANVLMGFIRNLDPSLCERARSEGLLVVGDQIIAPAPMELAAARLERERWPGWEGQTSEEEILPYVAWEEKTWERLDHVTCGSTYVADALATCGVPSTRVSVLPYPIDGTTYTPDDRSTRRGPITVGFVGSVSLRKGGPYFLETARALAGPGVRFVMVGPVEIDRSKLTSYSEAVTIVGPSPRGQIRRWLGEFDIFFFPSTCEGSATSVMEAMSTALPVVTTPSSGSIVRDGVDGFVVPSGNLARMKEGVSRLVDDARLRLDMGQRARERTEAFSLDTHSRALKDLLERALGGGESLPAATAAPARQGSSDPP